MQFYLNRLISCYCINVYTMDFAVELIVDRVEKSRLLKRMTMTDKIINEHTENVHFKFLLFHNVHIKHTHYV